MKNLLCYLPLVCLALIMGACGSRSQYSLDYLPVQTEDNRWTLMKPDGSTVDFDIKANSIDALNGIIVASTDRGKDVYTFDDKKCTPIDGLEDLNSAGLPSEGLIPIRKKEGGKLEFVNKKGEVQFTLPSQYNTYGLFLDGLQLVGSFDDESWEHKWGIINTKGEFVVKAGKYDDLTIYNEGLCAAKKGEKWMLLDTKGEVAATLNGVTRINSVVVDGRILVVKGDDTYGYCNTKGEFTKLKYRGVQLTDSYIIVADEEGQLGVVNFDGSIIIPLKYEDIDPLGDRFLCEKESGIYEVLNSDGSLAYKMKDKRVVSLDNKNPFITGNFLIGGESDDYQLYDPADGSAIKNSRFDRFNY